MVVQPTVYVVDDKEQSRMSVSALVRSMGLRTESFSSAEEFLGSYRKGQPGCLVTDVVMRGMSGLQLQETLQQQHIPLPVIILTAFAQVSMAVQAIKRGAVTLLEKPCGQNELWEAIRDALELDADTRAHHETREEYRRRLATLNSAELEVLQFVTEGVPNRLIAERLGKSLRTVEGRRGAIFAKTQVDTVARLVRLVMIAESDG